MPKKKNYPRWFSYYSPPVKPTKPSKYISQYKSIARLEGDCVPIEVLKEAIEKGSPTHFDVSGEDDYDGCTQSFLSLLVEEKIPYANYDKAMEKYNDQLAKYEEQSKEWKKYRAAWEAEVKKEQEDAERRLYEQLQKKFNK